jgi:hypothetical protein
MTTANPTTREFMSHTIELTDDLRFKVTGEEFANNQPRDCIFNSLVDAKARIEKLVSETSKVRAQNIVLALSVLQEDGTVVRVTKINRRDGTMNDVSGRYVYPNTDWLRGIIREHTRLNVEARKLYNIMSSVQISVTRRYGRIAAESYGQAISELKKQYDEMLALAKKMEFEAAKVSS